MIGGFSRMGETCPHYDSIRAARGMEINSVPSRDITPRCKHCVHWQSGQCDLFLARGK
jgi:hypothetical protein